MLESAVGAVGYVIRKLNQVRENGPSSQSRFEAIEILEGLILALAYAAPHLNRTPDGQAAPNRLLSTTQVFLQK